MRISKEAAPEGVESLRRPATLTDDPSMSRSSSCTAWAMPTRARSCSSGPSRCSARLEWLARDPLIGGDREGFGVVIDESTLAGATPVVTATVTFPKRQGEQGARRTGPVGEPEKATRRIAILEARWEDAFVPLDRRAVFKWAVPFMWRAFVRMLRLFAYTLVLVPWYVLQRHRRADATTTAAEVAHVIVDGIRLVASSALFA